jgi:hypothetical protein
MVLKAQGSKYKIYQVRGAPVTKCWVRYFWREAEGRGGSEAPNSCVEFRVAVW